MSDGFRNFDFSQEELEGRTTKFTLTTATGSESFEIDLNVDAEPLMDWLRNASKPESVPLFLDLFLDEEQTKRLWSVKPKWEHLQPVMVWLSSELGGPGGSPN